MNTRTFYAALCLVLLICLLLVTPVFASVEINVSQGTVGKVVTVIGLPPGQPYLVQWDGIVCAAGFMPSEAVTFVVPETVGGSHTVVIQSPQGTQVFKGVFTVVPAITISPESGTVGTTLSISGKGFAAIENVTVTYDGVSVSTGVAADSNGSWSTTFAAPVSPAGAHQVGASGNFTTAASVTTKTFTIKPTIEVSPLSGIVDTTVTVNGSGFAASESGIKVTFSNKDMKTGIAADSKGSWTATFNVPRTSGGDYAIDARGSITKPADIDDVNFSVVSGISIDKSTAYVGDAINLRGTGFGPNEAGIFIVIDDVAAGSSIIADQNGEWSISMPMPPCTNGNHVINARGSITPSSSALNKTITILAKITLDPAAGNVGDAINVAGSGFGSNKNITLTYGGDPVSTGASTDATGSFTASFKAPGGKHGDINVVATGADGVTASSIFAMETTAPSAPLIIYPKSGKTIGFIGDAKANFEWQAVTDPSGVYYDLQLASDKDFESIVFEHSGLTTPKYDSTDVEVLPHGEYYWRLRSVDGAGNASEWTAPARLKAGFMALSTLIIILVVAIVIVVIVIRARAIFFRKH